MIEDYFDVHFGEPYDELTDANGKPLRQGFYCNDDGDSRSFYYVYREGDEFFIDGIDEDYKHIPIRGNSYEDIEDLDGACTEGLVRLTRADIRKHVREYLSSMREFLNEHKRKKPSKIEMIAEQGGSSQ